MSINFRPNQLDLNYRNVLERKEISIKADTFRFVISKAWEMRRKRSRDLNGSRESSALNRN